MKVAVFCVLCGKNLATLQFEKIRENSENGNWRKTENYLRVLAFGKIWTF